MSNLVSLFSFNRAERRGVLVLIIILLVQIGVLIFLSQKKCSPPSVSYTTVPCFSDTGRYHPAAGKPGFINNTTANAAELFMFNPNSVTKKELQRLGLSEKQAQTIVNYRNKGGKFKTKADFRKMYSVTNTFFERVEPWIDLPDHYTREKEPGEKYRSYSDSSFRRGEGADVFRKVDINTAGIEALMQLRGIGEVYAARIIKYRDLLGGYCAVEQLNEVYGFPEETFEKVRKYVVAEQNMITGIPVNSVSYGALVRHPYIDKRLAYAIIEERKVRRYDSFEDFCSRMPAGIKPDNRLAFYFLF